MDNNKNYKTEKIEYFHENIGGDLGKIEKNKLYNGLINEITPALILKDYIIFYSEKKFRILF